MSKIAKATLPVNCYGFQPCFQPEIGSPSKLCVLVSLVKIRLPSEVVKNEFVLIRESVAKKNSHGLHRFHEESKVKTIFIRSGEPQD